MILSTLTLLWRSQFSDCRDLGIVDFVDKEIVRLSGEVTFIIFAAFLTCSVFDLN